MMNINNEEKVESYQNNCTIEEVLQKTNNEIWY